MESIFKKCNPHIVVHFAAQTHVDSSIISPQPFLKTNILGTAILLDLARKYSIGKFIHISTDEVYGEIGKGKFCEENPLSPSSPYAVSKASCDMLIKSYIRTHQFPAIIVRPSNTYGPWQHPEKFIPFSIYKVLNNEKISLYGRGTNVREWLYVSDCALAIKSVMEKGRVSGIYNVGSGVTKSNIEVAKIILKLLGKSQDFIEFVNDRPGHDLRYCLESSQIKKLGWLPQVSFSQGIKDTVSWYKNNYKWLEKKARYLEVYGKKSYFK
ncbi:MAG: GDP-mannose 4,6-dehydratase [Candidatus Omnitrophica bacterium]|nr:GDP-mannose 4,6-dehydratase [Candidatus Omnitrophota bacterium]